MAPVNLGTSVKQGTNSQIPLEGIAHEAILAGQAVMEDPTDGKIKLASCTNVTTPRKVGFALNSAPTPGQPVKYHYEGDLEGTATLVKGTNYVLSATAGSVCPEADLTTGQYTVYMGVANTTTGIRCHPHTAGVSRA